MDGKKKMREDYNGGGEDRISSLPPSLIYHIFSFMPTKYVVATSVLSTRWYYLWTSTSKIDICDHELLHSSTTKSCNPMVKASFMSFVDTVLCLHHAPTLTKFRISCHEQYDDTRVNAWISIALRYNVQELVLYFCLRRNFAFPRRIFNCRSLTRLKIDLDSAFFLQITDSTGFPNLKHLHLNFVCFCVDPATRQVFLSFPVLEEFYACDVTGLNISIIEISAPTLKRLILEENYDYINNDVEIVVDAENLVFLSVQSYFRREYSIRSKLSELNAIVDCSNSKYLLKLLGGLCNVKYLRLYANTIDSLLTIDDFVHLPAFSSLINLTVTLEGHGFDIGPQMDLLHKTPNVESLVFNEAYTCEYYESDPALEVIPQCVLSKLKSVRLNFFDGSESELCSVEFFLKNARSLERIAVISSEEMSKDPKKQAEITKQLLMMPRASTPCIVDFS